MTEKDIKIAGHGSGNPSTKVLQTYLNTRWNMSIGSKASVSKVTWDGISSSLKKALGMTYSGGTVKWHKALMAVLEPVGLTDTNGKKAHDKYKECLGRNIYTNSGKRSYVFSPYSDGKYYSDCSSSVSKCHSLTVNSSIGVIDTPAMMVSKQYKRVDGIKIVNGHITEGLEKLKPGMALMFAGSDWGRLKYDIVGHTEMVYEMPTVTTPQKVEEVLADVAQKAEEATKEIKASKPAYNFDKAVAGTYEVAESANLRNGAGTGESVLAVIGAGTKVKNYGYYTMTDRKWLKVQLTKAGVTYTGFMSEKVLRKV